MPSLWSCAVRPCTTNQTSLPRSLTGRKFLSDFFGRNKSSTLSIPEDVWHYYCRSHYQRLTYAARKSPLVSCDLHLDALTAQLHRIALWRPQARFTVQLQGAAGERLERYERELERNGGDHVAAEMTVRVPPKTGKKGAEILSSANAVDLAHARYVRDHLAGGDRSVDWILDNVIPWIEGEFRAGRMVRMPPVEFLIDVVRVGEEVHAVEGNWAAWDAAFPVGGGGGGGEGGGAASMRASTDPAGGGLAGPPVLSSTPEDVAAANILLDMFSSGSKTTAPPPLPLYVPPPPVSRKQPVPPPASATVSSPPSSVLDLPHVSSTAEPPLPLRGWRKYTRRAVVVRGMLFAKASTRFWHPDVEREFEEWPLVGDETEPETETEGEDEDEDEGEGLEKGKRKRDDEVEGDDEGEDEDDGDDVFKPSGKVQKVL